MEESKVALSLKSTGLVERLRTSIATSFTGRLAAAGAVAGVAEYAPTAEPATCRSSTWAVRPSHRERAWQSE